MAEKKLNIEKSIKVALAMQSKDRAWLASEMGVTKQRISQLMKQKGLNDDTFDKLLKVLNLSKAKFIKLGA